MTARRIWNKFHRAAALGIMLVFGALKPQADLEARRSFAQRAAEAGALEAQFAPPSREASRSQLSTVKRYEVFEKTFTIDSSSYANLWEDVEVNVTFTAPSSRRITVGGFYYGPNTWKVRLSPWEVGVWSWTAIARDRTATLQQQSGPFEVVESFQPGFVRRHSQNPFRLALENGKLFPAIGLGNCILNYDQSGSPVDNWGLEGDSRSGPGGAKGFTPSGKEVTPWHDCSSASDWCFLP